jgi:hypothetical protein
MYNFPGRMIGLAAHNDKALGLFIFRSSWIDYDYHDLAAQKQILDDAFAGHNEWNFRNYSTPHAATWSSTSTPSAGFTCQTRVAAGQDAIEDQAA